MVFARYVMFSEVYWHHAVRAATAMLQRAILSAARRRSTSTDLFDDDRAADDRRPARRGGADGAGQPSCSTASLAAQRRLYKRLAQYSYFEEPAIYRRLARRPYAELVPGGRGDRRDAYRPRSGEQVAAARSARRCAAGGARSRLRRRSVLSEAGRLSPTRRHLAGRAHARPASSSTTTSNGCGSSFTRESRKQFGSCQT